MGILKVLSRPIPLMIEEEQLKAAVRELYFALSTENKNFSAQLFRLFLKADSVNFEKLKLGFRAEALAVELWRGSGNETQFFREHGVTF